MVFTERCSQSAQRGDATVPKLILSVCLSSVDSVAVRLHSVTFKHRDHTGWNISKIISRPNSLRATWCNGNTPKLGWNRGGVRSTKNLQYSETMQNRTRLLLRTNRKSHTHFRLVPKSMTLDDPELQSLLSREGVKLRTSNLAGIHRAHRNKSPLKIFGVNGSVGVSRDCQSFLYTPYYLRNG